MDHTAGGPLQGREAAGSAMNCWNRVFYAAIRSKNQKEDCYEKVISVIIGDRYGVCGYRLHKE
jgi:hypothetical protein